MLRTTLLDLNNNFLRYTTALSLQPTPLETSALFLTNILPSLTKSLHFLNLATIISVNFAVSVHTNFTLSRPPTFLKITDRLFRYASSSLWKRLPDSFSSASPVLSGCLDSLPDSLVKQSLSLSSLSASITPSFFHSRLKTYLFNKSFPPSLYFSTHWTAFMIMGLDRIYDAHQFIF